MKTARSSFHSFWYSTRTQQTDRQRDGWLCRRRAWHYVLSRVKSFIVRLAIKITTQNWFEIKILHLKCIEIKIQITNISIIQNHKSFILLTLLMQTLHPTFAFYLSFVPNIVRRILNASFDLQTPKILLIVVSTINVSSLSWVYFYIKFQYRTKNI